MNIQENQNIGKLVALDYRAASIFKQHNIDFCCQGNRSIQEACDKQNIDSKLVTNDLEKTLQAKSSESTDYTSWPLDLLVDYIEKKHHRYVTEKTEEILPYLYKICEVHGNEHPELFEIKIQFDAAVEELKSHMEKEEMVLFGGFK
jgi:regulator of cell morphogenesis and NO signaling